MKLADTASALRLLRPAAPLLLAALAATAIPALAGTPEKAEPGVVHVNALKNPELHSYRAIVAGLDTFDELHALAPAVPQLLFQARTRGGEPLGSEILRGAAGTGGSPNTEPLRARLSADAFSLPLPLDDEARFQVPRSRQAWDAGAELMLSRKREDVRVWPYVRSPGLAANQQRLGDLRLECRVMIAIAKKEAPLAIVLLANTVMLSGDWCGFLKDKERSWTVNMPAKLDKAVLVDGSRSMNLDVKDSHFEVPLGDTSWSNEAVVELAFAPPAEPAAHAAEKDVPSVNVDSIRNPDMRSYRSVWAGLDAFDEHHALAPAAPLRFRILRTDGTPASAADGLALRLAGDESSMPVSVGADGLLTIARDRAAYDADASFILNQKKGRFSAVAEIRTPGLRANVRRLGDLRLECRVMVAIAKDGLNFVTRAAVNTLMLGSDWCGKKDMSLSFPVDRALDSARLSHGGRSVELDLHGKSYMAPVGNRAWPDDALIELTYTDEVAAVPVQASQ